MTVGTPHRYVSDGGLDGKAAHVGIGVGIAEVWTNEGGGWKPLARQGCKLPAWPDLA
jgi:hypothetical protein